MKKTTRQKRTVVYVRWFDASFQSDECTLDEFNPGVIVETAGILAREDKDSVSIALDFYAEQNLWRRIQHIPKPYILEMHKTRL